MTPLRWAAKEGYKEIVWSLLETGQADVNTKSEENGWCYTTLEWAIENNDEEVAQLVLDLGQVENGHRLDALSFAASREKKMVLLLLDTEQFDVNSQCENGGAPLRYAAEEKDEEIVQLLLSMGRLDLNWNDKDGRTGNVQLLLKTGRLER